MRKFLIAAALAAPLAVASAASAATYVDPWTVSPSGNIAVVFGDNGMDVPGAESIAGQTTTTHAYNSGTGAFTDTFSFQLPSGFVGFTLSSIGFAMSSSVTLSEFSFNGNALSFTNTPNGSGGVTVMASGGPFSVTSGGPQLLSVRGTAGPDAVFSGTATFEPLAVGVPEPSAWALMILGFGGAGAMLRRRRGTAVAT